MKDSLISHGGALRRSLPANGVRICISAFEKQLFHSVATVALDGEESSKMTKNKGEWFILPPFSPAVNASVLAKNFSVQHAEFNANTSFVSVTATTAFKWIFQCCPQIPKSTIQKLFRLRQVRREVTSEPSSAHAIEEHVKKLRRVAAKDSMNLGDQIFLPISVKEWSSKKLGLSCKKELSCNEKETTFMLSLVLYKDPAIIVVNKPPGMPVQGGVGVRKSLDELAARSLTYDYPEPPRLVHRLDRDSSGILVLARTQQCATLLHSLFREKTFRTSKEDLRYDGKILQKRYLALVIGSPPLSKGLISVPLRKVVVDDGKSERITLVSNSQIMSSQPAKTEYRVISSCHGYTWLELSPLTGRKHQLRVHCAEALGTPIVGDYKYGRIAHRKLKDLPWYDDNRDARTPCSDSGGHCRRDGAAYLHLHCKEMTLPDVSRFLGSTQLAAVDFSEGRSISLVAPLPVHMRRMWEFLHS